MSHLEEWDWEYRPVQMNTDANHQVVDDDSKDIVHTWYEVWDPACVTWATFHTYALAKEHARHLSGQIAHHVMYWRHFTQCYKHPEGFPKGCYFEVASYDMNIPDKEE
tara:strand:+ start:35 stop:358 length:324 start_codon:yes stop_codon:yes gene_type:complete